MNSKQGGNVKRNMVLEKCGTRNTNVLDLRILVQTERERKRQKKRTRGRERGRKNSRKREKNSRKTERKEKISRKKEREREKFEKEKGESKVLVLVLHFTYKCTLSKFFGCNHLYIKIPRLTFSSRFDQSLQYLQKIFSMRKRIVSEKVWKGKTVMKCQRVR